MITNLGHHGHMTWYILNTPDNIPSWDVMVASVWYIFNVLNVAQFGMVLVLRPRPYNVLAMYQVSTSPLAPSVNRDSTTTFSLLDPDEEEDVSDEAIGGVR